ncbi:MAG: GyrI-like domain-containing protein [Actinomycetota bacterium]|nr:GyrI-like domain-containing protein [Actinomycetota bacterium]
MDVQIVELEPVRAAAVRGEVGYDGLPTFFGHAFTEVFAAAERAGVAVVGPPFGFYPAMPSETAVVVEAGFPLAQALQAEGEVHPFELPGGTAAVTMHVGPYDTLAETYTRLMGWMSAHGYIPGEGMWESYLSDPGAEPDPSGWQTQIVWPVHRPAG